MDIGGCFFSMFLVFSVWKVAFCYVPLRYVMFLSPPCCLYSARDSSESPEETYIRSDSCTGSKKTFTLQLTPQCDPCVFTQALAANVLENTTVSTAVIRVPLVARPPTRFPASGPVLKTQHA
jgi:hypothetical protein